MKHRVYIIFDLRSANFNWYFTNNKLHRRWAACCYKRGLYYTRCKLRMNYSKTPHRGRVYVFCINLHTYRAWSLFWGIFEESTCLIQWANALFAFYRSRIFRVCSSLRGHILLRFNCNYKYNNSYSWGRSSVRLISRGVCNYYCNSQTSFCFTFFTTICNFRV